MPNIIFENKADSVDVKLLGGVGDGWFDDSVSIDNVTNIINNAKGKEINATISSLGGSHSEALVIRDLFKVHGNVNVTIIGLTASSGFTVATGATNKPKLSKYASILIHNVSVIMGGNAEQLRKQAENLDTLDSGLADILVDLTAQTKEFILDLMSQEKWLSPKDAKKYGFVSDIIEVGTNPTNEIIEQINNSYLPKFNNEINTKTMQEADKKSLFVEFKNWLGNGKDEDLTGKVTELKNEITSKDEALKASETKLETLQNSFDGEKSKVEANEAKITDLENKITELGKDESEKVKVLENKISGFENDLSEKLKEIDTLKIENAKLSGTDEPKNEQDKGSSKEELSKWAKLANEIKPNL